MDGQAPFRATTVDPRLYGFSRYDLLHDQHLVSMTGAGKLPSHFAAEREKDRDRDQEHDLNKDIDRPR